MMVVLGSGRPQKGDAVRAAGGVETQAGARVRRREGGLESEGGAATVSAGSM